MKQMNEIHIEQLRRNVAETILAAYDFDDWMITDQGSWESDSNRLSKICYAEKDEVTYTISFNVNFKEGSASVESVDSIEPETERDARAFTDEVKPGKPEPKRQVTLSTLEDYKRLLFLVAKGDIMVYQAANQDEDLGSEWRDQTLRFGINCSDTFYYACTDMTEFDITDTAELLEMFDKFGTDGLIAWSARDRNETPLSELIDENYQNAFAYAAKFFAPEYDYVLLFSRSQKEDLEAALAGLTYKMEVFDEKEGHLAIQVRLTEEKHFEMYKLVKCMYRIYSRNRVKECMFRYFNNYSVNSTCEAVARLIGLAYSCNDGFHEPLAS
jgi:hypothetical protein